MIRTPKKGAPMTNRERALATPLDRRRSAPPRRRTDHGRAPFVAGEEDVPAGSRTATRPWSRWPSSSIVDLRERGA